MSIQHVALFSLRAGVDRHDPRVASAALFSASHRDEIPEIDAWCTGFDVSQRAVSADFAVVGTFADMEAVARYLAHPHHREGVRRWNEVATWTVVDVEVDADDVVNGDV